MDSGRILQARGALTLGQWFDPACGRLCDDALATLAGKAVVLLGEKHDEAEHHRWQLHTVAGLHCSRGEMVLGFEMFPRRVQPVLERWTQGELGEAAFLEEAGWRQVWGFDPALYLPLFHFARMHRVAMRALNVDRDTNRRLAAEGFAALAPADREHVGEPAPATSAYRERLFGWFRHHPAFGAGAGLDDPRFLRFVLAQQFWDRAMAEAIADALASATRPLVVGIMGRGHVEYRDGVPRQLAALGITDVATALPWNVADGIPSSAPPVADLLFGIDSSEAAAGRPGDGPGRE